MAPGEILREIADGRALVPALREVGRDLDDLGEEVLGAWEVACLHGGHAVAEQAVDLGDAGAAPDLPERGGGVRRARGVVAGQLAIGLLLGHRRAASTPSSARRASRASPASAGHPRASARARGEIVAGALGDDERGGGGNAAPGRVQLGHRAEAVARAVHEDRGGAEGGEVRGAGLAGPLRRVQGIREEQQRVGEARRLRREHRGLPAAVGVAAQDEAAGRERAQRGHRVPQPRAVALGRRRGGAARWAAPGETADRSAGPSSPRPPWRRPSRPGSATRHCHPPRGRARARRPTREAGRCSQPRTAGPGGQGSSKRATEAHGPRSCPRRGSQARWSGRPSIRSRRGDPHGRRRHRLDRAHPDRQGLPRRVQQYPRRHPRRPCDRERRPARGHRARPRSRT